MSPHQNYQNDHIPKSFLFFLLKHLLYDNILLPINIDCLGDIPALCYDELDLLLSGRPQDLPIKCVYYALHRLVVAVSSIVGSGGDRVGLVLPGLLGGS